MSSQFLQKDKLLPLFQQLIIFVSALAMFLACVEVVDVKPNIFMFVPVSGLLVATALVNKRRLWVAILLGLLVVTIGMSNFVASAVISIVLAKLLKATYALAILKSFKGFDITLSHPRSFIYLAAVSLSIPVISWLFTHLSFQLGLGAALVPLDLPSYWMLESLGWFVLVVAVLAWNELPDMEVSRLLPILCMLFVTYLLGQIIFFDWYHATLGAINKGYWIFVAVALMAIVGEQRGVSICLAMVIFQAVLGTALHKGFFGADLQQSHLINLWAYLVALTTIGLTVSMVLHIRTKDEAALKKSERQLREMQTLAGFADWSVDLRSGQKIWSPEIYEIFGIDPSQGPASNDDMGRYISAASWSRLSAAIEQCSRTGERYECEAEVVRADHQTRWFVGRGEPVHDEQGNIVGLQGTIQDITTRKLEQLNLAASEENFRSLFENSPTAMVAIEPVTMKILQVNANATKLWGYTSDELLSMTVHDLTHPDDQNITQMQATLLRSGAPNYQARFEKRYLRKDGSTLWGDTTVAVITELAGLSTVNVGSTIDVTPRKTLEQQLQSRSMAIEQSPESIVITNTIATIEYVNEAFLKKSGYRRDELIGHNSRVLQSGRTPRSTYEALWRALSAGQTWEGEFINRTKDGIEYIEHAIVSPIREKDGKITHYVAVKEDITEKLRSQKKIHQLAYYDEVTQLPNSIMLQEHITQTLQRSKLTGLYGALISINLDRFKRVNDAGGQTFGNVLLKCVAEKLGGLLHSTDVVSHISGDEFSILLPELVEDLRDSAHLAMQVSQKLHAGLREPFQIDSNEIMLTACHGVVLFKGDEAVDAIDLLRRANTALHHAKSQGYEQTVFFESNLEKAVKQRFAVESELRHAIKENELRVFLQSQVDADGVIRGAEALIRWQHPERGLISPIHFIPMAEDSNLIIEIDNWMLTNVCEKLASMKDFALRVSINISPRHFNQPDFVEQIQNVLDKSGVLAEQLTLEVTEGLTLSNIDSVIEKMKELTDIGVHFSMDDFGTGYSSLSYLKRLPIQELKIDKSFVQDALVNESDGALIEVILSVASHLQLIVVAEGVETQAQADFLNLRGKVLHQGYLFSRPEPIESWMEKMPDNCMRRDLALSQSH